MNLAGLHKEGHPKSGAPAGENDTVVARRYLLREQLHRGGFGEVYAAEDLLAGRAVAVKLLPALEDHERLRGEISALRLLDLPGVAHLLDEGKHEGRPFLVMEMAYGRPFPGVGKPLPWNALRDTVVALLEILARVHAKGVFHRDLKPENVLVDGSGRPTVVDFGLSSGRAFGSGLEPDHAPVGTPAYVSPEQILGELVDARSDLYSFGVMVFEALAGRGPQAGDVPDEIMQKRLHEPARTLKDYAPDAPPSVVELVDRLLARERRHRPGSATEALRWLKGDGDPATPAHRLPRLGGDDPVRRLVEAARRGRSVDLVGAHGTGRTRCLEEARERLERNSQRVVWIEPRTKPFESLRPLRAFEAQEPTTIFSAWELEERCVQRALLDGAVLLVDDWEELDRWSRTLLARSRSKGSVISVRLQASREAERTPTHEVVYLASLDEKDLRPLFAGPDRLFHLQEDGARELWSRSDGLPARVVDELAAWIRAGLAEWSEEAFVVDRAALDRLRSGLEVLPQVESSQVLPAPLNESLAELLSWVALSSPQASPELLASLTEEPAWMIEAELEELAEAGAVRRHPDGRVQAMVSALRPDGWSEEERREAHARVATALPHGAEGRLFHLVAAGELLEAPAEARRVARRLVREGRLGEAEAALGEGLHAARQLGDVLAETRLFREWISVALGWFTPLAIDRLLYELSRALEKTPEVVHLEAFVHSAMTTLSTEWVRGLTEVEAVEPFDDPEIERWRQAIRVQAARGCSTEIEERVLNDISAWAEGLRKRDADIEASLAEWLGRLRYRQDRFDEAAKLQARAAQQGTRVTARLSAMLNGASALVEACRFDEVIEVATRARELAAKCRHALYELRAEWLLRAANYRKGSASQPDLELVEAAGLVGGRDQEALVCLTEAAVAWRADELKIACELAERARRYWSAAGKVWGDLLARSLALACGAEPAADEVEELATRALDCPSVEISGQILALLHGMGARPEDAWQRIALGIREKFPRELWSKRRDVLSIDEMLEALEAD